MRGSSVSINIALVHCLGEIDNLAMKQTSYSNLIMFLNNGNSQNKMILEIKKLFERFTFQCIQMFYFTTN